MPHPPPSCDDLLSRPSLLAGFSSNEAWRTDQLLASHLRLCLHPLLPLCQVIFVLPTAYPVTKENLNYAGVAVAVVLVFSLG